MTDPERLNRTGGFGAALLRAGAAERPSPQSLQRTLVALGASGACVAVAASAPAASSAVAGGSAAVAGGGSAGAVKGASLALLGKWVGIGVVSGVGMTAVVSPLVTEGPTRVAPASSAPASRTAAPPYRAPGPSPSSVVDAAPLETLEPDPVAVRAPSPSRSGRASPPSPSDLAVEIGRVDAARAMLQRGESGAALESLAGYETAFPSGRLLPEVLFLRLMAFEARGDRASAARVAERLVREFPNTAPAARARESLAR